MLDTIGTDKMSTKQSLVFCILIISLSLKGLNGDFTFTLNTASIEENSAAGTSVETLAATGGTGTVTYAIDGTSNEFSIATAELQVKTGATLDFETKPTYTLIITADDTATTATATLTVSITDVNEPPKFTGSFSACVNKSAPADTLITTVTATDPDTGDVIAYDITGGDDYTVFKVNASGAIATKKTVPASPTSYTLTYTATDDDGTPATATATVTLTVGDPCPAVPNHGNVNNGNNLNGNQPNHDNGNNGNNLNGNQNTNTTQNQNGNFATRSQCNIYVPLLGVAMAVLKSIL